jgi:hypothetical protein
VAASNEDGTKQFVDKGFHGLEGLFVLMSSGFGFDAQVVGATGGLWN